MTQAKVVALKGGHSIVTLKLS